MVGCFWNTGRQPYLPWWLRISSGADSCTSRLHGMSTQPRSFPRAGGQRLSSPLKLSFLYPLPSTSRDGQKPRHFVGFAEQSVWSTVWAGHNPDLFFWEQISIPGSIARLCRNRNLQNLQFFISHFWPPYHTHLRFWFFLCHEVARESGLKASSMLVTCGLRSLSLNTEVISLGSHMGRHIAPVRISLDIHFYTTHSNKESCMGGVAEPKDFCFLSQIWFNLSPRKPGQDTFVEVPFTIWCLSQGRGNVGQGYYLPRTYYVPRLPIPCLTESSLYSQGGGF